MFPTGERIEVDFMARIQTKSEEKWNASTHGFMAILITLLLPFAIRTIRSGGAVTASRDTALITVFCLCLILMFSASAFYHRQPAGSRAKQLLKKFDHIAIYFAIAGSYTPLAIMVVGGRRGAALLTVEWLLVLAGVLFKLRHKNASRFLEVVSVSLYLAMGWGIVILFPQFVANAQAACLWLILSGGLAYTIGIIFYALKRPYAHVVWHFFVNIGAICHFLAIVFFI